MYYYQSKKLKVRNVYIGRKNISFIKSVIVHIGFFFFFIHCLKGINYNKKGHRLGKIPQHI